VMDKLGWLSEFPMIGPRCGRDRQLPDGIGYPKNVEADCHLRRDFLFRAWAGPMRASRTDMAVDLTIAERRSHFRRGISSGRPKTFPYHFGQGSFGLEILENMSPPIEIRPRSRNCEEYELQQRLMSNTIERTKKPRSESNVSHACTYGRGGPLDTFYAKEGGPSVFGVGGSTARKGRRDEGHGHSPGREP